MKRALYGNCRLNRDYCKTCCTYALIIDSKFACCGSSNLDEPNQIERMCESTFIRRGPSKQLKKLLLDKFYNACAYCGRVFCQWIKLQWDHFEPYSWSADNSEDNFLPSCLRCNIIKKDLMFKDLEEARVYILSKVDKRTNEW